VTFWQVMTIEARKRMSYRADFWLGAILGLGAQIGICIFLALAIFRESGSERIGEYTVRGMVLYYVVVQLVAKIVRSTEMEMGVSQDIYEGGLTRYLLYPTSYGLFKYAQQLGALAPSLIQVLLLGAWVPFVFAGEAEVTLASAVMCLAAIAVANVLYFLLGTVIQLVAFWADNVWSLMVANRIAAALFGGFMIPLSLFPPWARAILAWTPFPYLFAFPLDALFGRLSPADWARGMGLALGWCGGVAILGKILWRRGMIQYTGVGI